MQLKSDEYYIKSVLEGNTREYAILVEKYKDMVFTIALRITCNREDAEEVAQDSFVKAFNSLGLFRFQSKFSTWLYSIVYNHAISFKRKKQLDVCSLDNLNNALHETYGENDNQFALLDGIPHKYALKALQSIDEIDQVILTLYYQNENSVKEISKITGLSNANVKVRLFRGRKKLLLELEKIFKTELVDL